MEKVEVTEKDIDVIRGWYDEAREMTLERLPEFHRHLMEDYQHDYGTVCHAISAGSVASAWALNNHSAVDITTFQAKFVMWGFIQNWSLEYKDQPLCLVTYKDMLYPQSSDTFEKTITSDTWKYLQEEALKLLSASRRQSREVNNGSSIQEHWQSIVDGNVPFGYQVKEDD